MALAKGRPVGLLIAWLWSARERPSRAAHADMVVLKRRTDDDKLALSLETRQVARNWARENIPFVLTLERAQRPGEPEEPEGLA